MPFACFLIIHMHSPFPFGLVTPSLSKKGRYGKGFQRAVWKFLEFCCLPYNLIRELCFSPEEITWRWFWQSVVKEHLKSGCFISFSVLQRFLCGFSFTKSLCASCQQRNRLFDSSHMILKQPLVKEEVCSCLDPWCHPNVIFLGLTCHLKIQDNPFAQQKNPISFKIMLFQFVKAKFKSFFLLLFPFFSNSPTTSQISTWLLWE